MKMNLDSPTKLKLFYEMQRIRLIEETIANRYKEKKMRCPTHLSIGQEGVAVGVCQALDQDDLLVSNHRAHAHYLAKGGNLNKMIAEIHGKVGGCSVGRGGSMHLVDLSQGFYGSTPIVAGSIPIGVGLAFALQMKKSPKIAAIFFGEGATEEGVFGECLNFASLKNLPVLFICENNYYSVYSPLSVRQSEKRSRIDIAKAHGLYTDSGDGNDVEETYAKAKKALSHIREGKGSAFLEFSTYRYREHCGPNYDTDLGYRTEAEVTYWESLCPIKRTYKKLTSENILSTEKLTNLEAQIKAEIDAAFIFAEESPFPKFDLDHEKEYAD